jgi:hypothetical protein
MLYIAKRNIGDHITLHQHQASRFIFSSLLIQKQKIVSEKKRKVFTLWRRQSPSVVTRHRSPP